MKTIILRTVETHGPASTIRNLVCLDLKDAKAKAFLLDESTSSIAFVERTTNRKGELVEKEIEKFVRVAGEWYTLGKKLEK